LLMSASAATLQDMGFHIDESVPELGFLRASKERSAREHGQHASRFMFYVLTLGSRISPVDLHQQIVATIVTSVLPPTPGAEWLARNEVRVMFYRVVWKGHGASWWEELPPGQQRMEMIRDPVIYQQFFTKLSKSVFLEAITL